MEDVQLLTPNIVLGKTGHNCMCYVTLWQLPTEGVITPINPPPPWIRA